MIVGEGPVEFVPQRWPLGAFSSVVQLGGQLGGERVARVSPRPRRDHVKLEKRLPGKPAFFSAENGSARHPLRGMVVPP